MILMQTSGQYDGTRYSDYHHPRDIRVRLNEFGTMDMHIQHPNASVLSDPLEFTQEQVANLASTLARLDRSMRYLPDSYDDNEWEGMTELMWHEKTMQDQQEYDPPYDDGQPDEMQEWHDYDPDC